MKKYNKQNKIQHYKPLITKKTLIPSTCLWLNLQRPQLETLNCFNQVEQVHLQPGKVSILLCLKPVLSVEDP